MLRIVSRIGQFLRLPAAERRAVREAVAGLAVSQLSLAWAPGRTLARLRRAPVEHSAAMTPAQCMDVRLVARSLDRGTRAMPWNCSCLVRALAGERMLHRRGLPSAIDFGVAAGEGGFGAHATLRSGGIAVCGVAEAHRFAPIARFTGDIRGQ